MMYLPGGKSTLSNASLEFEWLPEVTTLGLESTYCLSTLFLPSGAYIMVHKKCINIAKERK